MRTSFKRYLLGFLVFFAALAGAVIFTSRPKPIPPLPFDASNFVSTTTNSYITPPPPTASFGTRALYFLYDEKQKIFGKSVPKWSFGASPKTACSIQGLLNQCANVTGNRYLMPPDIAAGVVQFGNTNTLNGPEWVAAFETELKTGNVQWWDQQNQQRRWEHLALLRFPEQKTVLVLPESSAADFLRTNGIHVPPETK